MQTVTLHVGTALQILIEPPQHTLRKVKTIAIAVLFCGKQSCKTFVSTGLVVKEIHSDANVLECRLHIWNNGYFVWTKTYFSQINLWFVSEPYFCIGNENNGKNDRANL